MQGKPEYVRSKVVGTLFGPGESGSHMHRAGPELYLFRLCMPERFQIQLEHLAAIHTQLCLMSQLSKKPGGCLLLLAYMGKAKAY
jgi:hypothetical protein